MRERLDDLEIVFQDPKFSIQNPYHSIKVTVSQVAAITLQSGPSSQRTGQRRRSSLSRRRLPALTWPSKWFLLDDRRPFLFNNLCEIVRGKKRREAPLKPNQVEQSTEGDGSRQGQGHPKRC